MHIPLQIGKDYIPCAQRQRTIKTKKSPNIYTESRCARLKEAARTLDLARSTFLPKNKRNRAIGILGAGDYVKGYRRYEDILKRAAKSFEEIDGILRELPRGYVTFNRYRGAEKKQYMSQLRADANKHPLTTYSRLIKIHAILKDFEAFQAPRSGDSFYLPLSKRKPITKNFLTTYNKKLGINLDVLARDLFVPMEWMRAETKRLGWKTQQ